ncbi:hypothetical protein ACROYT_G040350 [Oculina patagonica]
MGMSVQKKFILGLVSFILFVFIIGFIIGFFGCPRASDKSCCGAKNGNDDTSGRLFEEEALELLSGQNIRHYLKYFASQPHLAEANETCAQALYIKKEWNSFGLETVQLKRYDVLLPYPKSPSALTLTDDNGAVIYSSLLIENLTTAENDSRTAFPFSIYSASGLATGKLLYVNYGRESDFKYLDDRNISCTGKILIVRNGKILEGNKVVNAQKWNAKGLLLYVDPADYAFNATIKNLTQIIKWYPSNKAQSGGLWVNRGDPLTPGYPASAGIYRESLDDIALPKIPVQPISHRDAETLLRMLNHTNVPNDWQGGMGFSYGIEMDPNDTRNVTISVSLSFIKRAVCDVVGTIKGAVEPGGDNDSTVGGGVKIDGGGEGADCPSHQRQFLLKTATPQQMHALVQLIYNVLMENIPISEEDKRKVIPYKDALVNLVEPNVPFKTKKRILVQEGGGFIQELLTPVISSLGLLML